MRLICGWGGFVDVSAVISFSQKNREKECLINKKDTSKKYLLNSNFVKKCISYYTLYLFCLKMSKKNKATLITSDFWII